MVRVGLPQLAYLLLIVAVSSGAPHRSSAHPEEERGFKDNPPRRVSMAG
jgi:hypothetical protein